MTYAGKGSPEEIYNCRKKNKELPKKMVPFIPCPAFPVRHPPLKNWHPRAEGLLLWQSLNPLKAILHMNFMDIGIGLGYDLHEENVIKQRSGRMPQTILVVEDDKDINEVVTEYLKDAGFIVLSYSDGRGAQTVLNQNKSIDFFILDIMLPGLNGLELLKLIRSSEFHKEKLVLMLTALDDEATQILSFDELADDYVVKPFSPRGLVKRVEKLIRRQVDGRKLLQCGDIILDYDSYEAFEGKENIKLTYREFELLACLMNHAGKVLSRQQLLNHAWGYEYFGDERIVDVHIKNLRKKLKSEVIVTVKGVGYKLEGGRGNA